MAHNLATSNDNPAFKKEDYKDIPQVVINSYTLRPADYPKTAFRTPPITDPNQAIITLFCRRFTDPDLGAFVDRLRQHLFNNGHMEILKDVPAGAKNHHSYRAGLLYHMLQMVNMASDVADQLNGYYPGLVNKELLWVGILLHDLYKTLDYDPEILTSITRQEGELIGHTILGYKLIGHLWPAEGSSQTRLFLEHLVLAHHGYPETGAAVHMKTIEATVLHAVDSLSARADVFHRNLQMNIEGEASTWEKALGGIVPISPVWPKPTTIATL